MKIIKYFFLCSCLFGILTGCASEPMIKLSKENQAKLEQKHQKETQKEKYKTTEASKEKKSASPVETLDTSTWKKAASNEVFDLNDFFPISENEIRKFSNGKTRKYVYLTHKNSTTSYAQTVTIQGKQVNVQTWQWDGEAIKTHQLPLNSLPFVSAEKLTGTQEDSEIWLQAPVQMKKKWTNGNQEAQITGMYTQATINNQTYQNVIEVDLGKHKQYIAQNIGLIAETDQKSTWLIENRDQEVKLITPVEIWQPDDQKKTVLKSIQTDMAWQTNGSLATSLTKLFQDQQWIGPEIQVNAVTIEDDYVQVDFSSGVVATLNAHPSGEQAVLAAIIANTSQWTQRDKVKITVNNYIMTPATLQFPPQGIYDNNLQWQKSYMEQPLTTLSNE